MATTDLTAERLRAVLDYDPETGVFTWKQRRKNCRVGAIAGSATVRGYIEIKIDGKHHLAHRLAWLHVHGTWPTNVIDHIDGNGSNNAISNLRDVTQSQNAENRKRAHANNKCGLLGVGRSRSKWRARILLYGEELHLGTFDTPEEAHAVYLAAKRELHVGNTI
jgi:hypothetical protein